MAVYSLLKLEGGSKRRILMISGLCFMLLLILSISIPTKSYALAPRGGRPLTEQEIWVLAQIKRGQEADLNQRFDGNDTKRRLPAQFIETLVTKGIKGLTIPHQGIEILNAIIEGPLNLAYAEVDSYLNLSQCFFDSSVNLQGSNFKKDLSFNGSTFNGKANFNGMKVDGSAFFEQVKFSQPVDFRCLYIGQQFNLNAAEFQSKADFNSLRVTQNAFFKKVKFHGAVNFMVADIHGQYHADEAKFLNPEETVDFRGIKVGNSIFFLKAIFYGPVKFDYAEIGANFRANQACFRRGYGLPRIKVGHKMFLNGVTILSNVDMSYGDFYDLEINEVSEDAKGEAGNINIPHLNLQGAHVQSELIIANAKIGELHACQLQVKGTIYFNNLEIINAADFQNSNFQKIDFINIKWPVENAEKGIRKVYLGGATYAYININKSNGIDYSEHDFQEVKKFLKASPFNTQNYVQLEAFFKRIGKENWSNDVFISMNNRDIAEKKSWGGWLKWFFWGKLAGYGRAPLRVIGVSIALICFCAFFYDPELLEKSTQPIDNPRFNSAFMNALYSIYNKHLERKLVRLFLSIDQFLPVKVDLKLAQNWDYKKSRRICKFIFLFEHLLGWILVPIGLASIYTQIK